MLLPDAPPRPVPYAYDCIDCAGVGMYRVACGAEGCGAGETRPYCAGCAGAYDELPYVGLAGGPPEYCPDLEPAAGNAGLCCP